MKRLLAIALSASLAFSYGNVTALVSTYADATSGVTITEVTYGTNYVATTADDDYNGTADSGNDWINSPSASSNVVSVTLSDGTTKTASSGVLTLVVNGAEEDILDYKEAGTVLEAGTYSFEETSGGTVYSEGAKFMNMGGQTAQYTFRQALKIADGAVDADETITALLDGDTYNGTSFKGTIDVNGAFFNAIYVAGASDYTVTQSTITAEGDGANDFNGQGAALLVQDTGSLTIDNTYVETAGVIRTAAAVKGSATLNITDSVIYAQEGDDTDEEYVALVVPMMKRTPFALGLEGTIRATNVLGAGKGVYSDSLIVCTGWGVLSTDSGQSGTQALTVDNVVAGIGEVEVAQAAKVYDATKEVNDVTYGFTYVDDYSGYVAYADSGVIDNFTNCTFYAPDYVQIMASSTSTATYEDCTLYSGRIGVMTQQNAGGTITFKNSTITVDDCLAQIKSGAANNGYTNVVIDGCDVDIAGSNPYSGVLVELVESDDAGNPGNTTYTIQDDGDDATTESSLGTITESTAVIKNGTYTGDIYNNIYNYTQDLDVTLSDNATVNGTISSSYGYHVDESGNRLADGTVISAYAYADYRGQDSDAKIIGSQVNVPSATVNNKVNLTVESGSVWNVEANSTNYLGDVVLADESCLSGGSGAKVSVQTLTVGSTTYTEEATVTVNGISVAVGGAVATATADTGIIGSATSYQSSATKVTFKAVDSDGNNCAAGVSFASGYPKSNVDGTISAAFDLTDGYELVSVAGTDNCTVAGPVDGVYTVTPATDATTATVTVTVKKAGSTSTDSSTTVADKKGDTITKGSVVYTITNVSKKTVAVTGLAKAAKKKATLTIQNTVKSTNGVSYTVTAIKGKALAGAKKLKTLKVNAKSL
ncbi:MAG: hypothetical protein K5840_07560, partial [Eubacterium sp.]|nr:hypothetical protein [Eubacterium sp.]